MRERTIFKEINSIRLALYGVNLENSLRSSLKEETFDTIPLLYKLKLLVHCKLSSWFGKYLSRPRGRFITLVPRRRLRVLLYIHYYSSPVRGIVVFYNLLFSILFFYVYICTMVLDMYYVYSVMISNSLTTCKSHFLRYIYV